MKNTPSFSRVGKIHLSVFNPEYTVRSQTVNFLKANLNKKYQSVLDYGAGESPYEHLTQYEKYTRIDIEQNQLNNIDLFLNPSTLHIPVPDNSFDLITCYDVLEHVTDINLALDEIVRVLKNNGEIIIKIPFLYREHELPYDYRRLTQEGLIHLLKKFNFTIESNRKLGNACSVLYTLFNEKYFDSNQKMSFCSKLIRKIVNWTLLPILNKTLFLSDAQRIYSAVIVIAKIQK